MVDTKIKRFTAPTEQPVFVQNEQLTEEDFRNITQLPIKSLGNALTTVFHGQTGILEGLTLEVVNGEVFVTRGFGVVTNINATDPSKIDGTFIVVNNKKTKIFNVSDLPVSSIVMIYLTHEIKNQGVKTRNFVREDGSIRSQDIVTVIEHGWSPGWLNKWGAGPYYNMIPIGKIDTGGLSPTVIQWDHPILTLYGHKTATPIDHPDGSIQARHIDPALIGATYEAGKDLSIEAISDILVGLKGNMESASARIKAVVDEGGNVNNEAIATVVEQLVQSHLAGLTDGQGNLSQNAIEETTDDQGRPLVYQIGIWAGQVDGNLGRAQIPTGFSLEETIFFPGIARLHWDQFHGSSVELNCEISREGVVQCYATVNAQSAKKYYGTATVISIAIKPRRS